MISTNLYFGDIFVGHHSRLRYRVVDDRCCHGDGCQGDDDVMECVYNNTKDFVNVRLSKNDDKNNKPISQVRFALC